MGNNNTPPSPNIESGRNVNFEILRSLSMLFIVMLHYLKSVGDVLSFDISTGAGLFNYIASTFLFYLVFNSSSMFCYDNRFFSHQ